MRSSSWYPKLMPSRRDLLILTGVAGVGSKALSGYALAEAFR